MRKLRLLSLLSIAIVFVAASCTKEGPEGPVGATGGQGVPGANGAPGAAGAAGAAGPAGTANVIYSSWVATVVADWVPGFIAPNNYNVESAYNRTAAGVTQAVIDNGVVLAYGKGFTIGAATIMAGVSQLPYQEAFNDQFYGYILNPGKITFTYDPIATIRPVSQLAGISYRYVIIPGGVAGGKFTTGPAKGRSTAELKKMPYESIAQLFNIPESGSNAE